MNAIKVINIENTFTSRGIPYQIITFKENIFERTDLIGKRCFWPPRNIQVRNQNNQLINQVWEGSPLYNQLNVGDLVAGSLITINTTNYFINDRSKNKFICVLFDHENDKLRTAARELIYLKLDAKPLDDNGNTYTYVPTVIEAYEHNEDF